MGERPDALNEESRRERGQASGVGETGETEQIRAEIAETRAEMAETIDALQAQLRPEHLTEQAKESVQQATVGRVRRSLGRASQQARVRVQTVRASWTSQASRERLAAGRQSAFLVIRTRRPNNLSRGGLLGIGSGALAALGGGLGIVWLARRRQAARRRPAERLRRAQAELRARARRQAELAQSLVAQDVAQRTGNLSGAFALLVLGLLLGWRLRERRLRVEQEAVLGENREPARNLSVPLITHDQKQELRH